MIRRLYFTFLLIVFLSLFVAQPVAAKAYYAERFDVVVAVQADGSLVVTETIRFRFDGGPFTYAFRELSFRNLDQIENVQAAMDGQPLSAGTSAGQVEITGSRPLKVTWHFTPTSDSTHTFTLTYRVQGAIRRNDGADVLIWRAIPEDHEYEIRQSAVRVEYPAGLAPASAPVLSRADAAAESEPGSVTFRVTGVDEDDEVDVTVLFPAGSLVSQPPVWQAEREQRQALVSAALPYGLAAAALVGLMLTAVIAQSLRRFRRDRSDVLPFTPDVRVPPKPIAPALAARLTGGSTSFLGTLFDLAERGFLRIEEGPRRWGGRTFEIVRLAGAGWLAPHEQEFLGALFRRAQSGRVNLNQIAGLASNSAYIRALDEELAAAGWRDPERAGQRGWFLLWSGLGLVVGMAALVAGLVLAGLANPSLVRVIAGAILIGGGAACGGVCLVGLFIAALTSTLSDEGLRQAAAWSGFTGYLRGVTRGGEPNATADLFGRYLAYAAAFGLATEWGKTFQKVADVPLPQWFKGLGSGLDDGSFIAVLSAISSADSSASAASGAGGGASGGGSSGAG